MQTKWMKKLTLPVLAMLFIYYATRTEDPAARNLVDTMSEQPMQEQSVYSTEDCYTIYALHESDNLVKTFVPKDEANDPIQAIFEIFTTKSNQLPVGTTSLVSPMTKLNDYRLEDGVLTLNVSPEFLDYTTSEEQDVLSSLVWTYTELTDVDKVKFEIDGEAVSNLNGSLPVSRGLDRSMGINLELDAMNLDDTQLVTLYFMTDDTKNGMLVPVTRLISSSVDPVTYAVNALIQGPTNHENYVTVFNHETMLLNDPVISEGLVSLNFSSELYYDSQQTKVSSTMLNQLVMTLTELDDIEMVSVSIDGNIKVMDDANHSIAVPTSRFDFEDSTLIEAQ
ncbi:GerMN domain-containing protein [Turicibacter sp. TJ11]|uniref:GerMN domain-containing protein n=1 Tax=Turicibacter sp. TJ11 TaxID=2806443 RepID=UPI001F223CE7|nr:GerMN domain-containing protein [Turicibacter sp. TJ11]